VHLVASRTKARNPAKRHFAEPTGPRRKQVRNPALQIFKALRDARARKQAAKEGNESTQNAGFPTTSGPRSPLEGLHAPALSSGRDAGSGQLSQDEDASSAATDTESSDSSGSSVESGMPRWQTRNRPRQLLLGSEDQLLDQGQTPSGQAHRGGDAPVQNNCGPPEVSLAAEQEQGQQQEQRTKPKGWRRSRELHLLQIFSFDKYVFLGIKGTCLLEANVHKACRGRCAWLSVLA
jgi:hypothetical protein